MFCKLLCPRSFVCLFVHIQLHNGRYIFRRRKERAKPYAQKYMNTLKDIYSQNVRLQVHVPTLIRVCCSVLQCVAVCVATCKFMCPRSLVPATDAHALISVYIYIYICIHMYMCVYIYVYIYGYMYLCIHLYIYIYTYTYIYVYTYI